MSFNYDDIVATTKAFEKGTNVLVSKFAVIEQFQAAAFVALVQPLFTSPLSIAIDPGPPGWEYQYPDEADTRRVWCFFSEDHTVQAQWIGPLIQIMFKQGNGFGQWAMESRKEVGGRSPGKLFPPTLTWHGGISTGKSPLVVTSVNVTSDQAKLIGNV